MCLRGGRWSGVGCEVGWRGCRGLSCYAGRAMEGGWIFLRVVLRALSETLSHLERCEVVGVGNDFIEGWMGWLGNAFLASTVTVYIATN